MSPVLQLEDAGLRFGERTLWQHLDLQVEPGEFLTVLGPNGSGKSSLLKVLLGLLPLSSGRALLEGRPVRRGARSVGYVPQLRGFGADVPLRGRDLVRLGVDGHRCGLPSRRGREQVRRLLAQVEGERLGGVPLGRMSGGEQQRMRLAQALATSPRLLLCDEPLLSLDPRHQERVVDLVDRRRRTHGTAVVFVTHEIEPVAAVSDRVLRLREGVASLGSPEEVLRSDVLSAFYGADVVLAHR